MPKRASTVHRRVRSAESCALVWPTKHTCNGIFSFRANSCSRRITNIISYLASGPPLRPLPPLLFPSKCPPPFTQLQMLSTQVLAFVLPTSWVQRSQHALTSPSSILFLTCVCPPRIPTLLASGPTFSAAAVYPLFARLPRETISLCWVASPPVNAVRRLALSASTSSRIN